MAEIQSAVRLQWTDAAEAQATVRLAWDDAATVQSVGSAYTSPAGSPAGVPPAGSLAPRVDVLAAAVYSATHSLSVVDLRTGNEEGSGTSVPQIVGWVKNNGIGSSFTLPAHQAGDLILLYLRTTSSATVPALPTGWTAVLQSIGSGAPNGWRIASRVDTANTLSLITVAPADQAWALVLRNARVGSKDVSGLLSGTSGASPSLAITKPGRSMVISGVCANQTATVTPPAALSLLGNNGTPELSGGRWAAYNTAAGLTTYVGGNFTLSTGAFLQTWSVEIMPLPDPPTPPDALDVESVSIELQDGSDMWTLSARGARSLYDALTTGDQPPLVGVTVNGQQWAFVVEAIQAPQAFASNACSFSGRSLAALADGPYQNEQQWITDAPTTAAQVATIAQTFTGLEVLWQTADWLMPDGVSLSGSPMAVVRQLARAIGAVVEADPLAQSVAVRSRYAVLPNLWATTAPDWQVHWQAVTAADYALADTPEVNAVYVAGQQQGALLTARLEGTNGAVQAPMVTDPLLTDSAGLLERATAILAAAGKQARITRTLQLDTRGYMPRGALVRWVDPNETWTGMVRAVSVQASMGMARQTVTVERRTAFQAGLYTP